jgi:hypothetical protein
VSVATRKFTIDNVTVRPSARPNRPPGIMIGKIISIEAKVDDPAGRHEASSVIAVVANGDVHFESTWSRAPTESIGNSSTPRSFPIYAIFPSVSFRAQDILGNESSMGYLVSLDNTPPILDLDPPADFQLIRKDGNLQLAA